MGGAGPGALADAAAAWLADRLARPRPRTAPSVDAAAPAPDAPPPAAAAPVVVGVSGPQGGGKSTLCAELVGRLTAAGHPAVAVSIDDFYLTREAQLAVAAAHPGNPFLEHRGCPGTHDVALGEAVLAALTARPFAPVALPLYDKGAHGGRGDRAPAAAWPTIERPPAVVLLEGWMLGFRPVPAAALADPGLAPVNAALADYARWHRFLDAFVHLTAGDWTTGPSEEGLAHIVAWRVDAERARRAAGAPGLTDAEALDYIRRFLPAYRTWVPALAVDPGVGGPVLRVRLARDRSAVEIAARPALGFPESPRLRFARWGDGEADRERGRALWGDGAVMRFLDRRGAWDAAGIDARLAREAESLGRHGVQYWALFARDSGEFVGCCGLHACPGAAAPPGPVYELGFHLRPAFWGRGLAREAGAAVVRYAFDVLGAAELVAGHHPDNDGSRRVIAALGFAAAKPELYPPTGLVHPCYRLLPPGAGH